MPKANYAEDSKLIMDCLERLEDTDKSQASAINLINTNIAVLKVKVGLWGAMGGAIGSAVLVAIIEVALHFLGAK